jgi:hypothetical protein
MKKGEERSKRRVWKFSEIVKRKRINMERERERYRKDQVL